MTGHAIVLVDVYANVIVGDFRYGQVEGRQETVLAVSDLGG